MFEHSDLWSHSLRRFLARHLVPSVSRACPVLSLLGFAFLLSRRTNMVNSALGGADYVSDALNSDDEMQRKPLSDLQGDQAVDQPGASLGCRRAVRARGGVRRVDRARPFGRASPSATPSTRTRSATTFGDASGHAAATTSGGSRPTTSTSQASRAPLQARAWPSRATPKPPSSSTSRPGQPS